MKLTIEEVVKACTAIVMENGNDSARLCLHDANALIAKGDHVSARRRLADAIKHSVGIFHPLHDQILAGATRAIDESGSTADDAFVSHSSFKLPRVPAGRFVTCQLSSSAYPLDYFQGLFETSGCKHMGRQDEVYILRRVAPPGAAPVFIEVPRRWQELGHMTVYQLQKDAAYMPSTAIQEQ